jgi:hypothetical protein
MTATCALISVAWICYHKYRPAYVVYVAVIGVGLIGTNFHFLSDLIAGVLLN